jgi:regulator of sirC expression with transglutaminase-like and TPR domain
MSMEREIKSLFKLLDDEDSGVSRAAVERLIQIGSKALPLISEYRKYAEGKIQTVLNQIIETIRFNQFKSEISNYLSSDEHDLERGVFLVSKFAYPDIDVKKYIEMLDLMALDLKKRIYPRENLVEIINAVNRYIFREKGFRGNRENYYDPDNSYINRVMERKLGIPISLSVVYILIGRRANLPVYGVGLPAHFVVRYEFNGVEIYVDVFNSGRLMTRDDCIKLIGSSGYSYREEYFRRADSLNIIERMIRNLVIAYSNSGERERAGQLMEVLDMF